jgi:hypothetical protein
VIPARVFFMRGSGALWSSSSRKGLMPQVDCYLQPDLEDKAG